MKIVQTFWSANRSLLRHNFGWFSAQYHVMAWALSCLRAKEYYEDVQLYTDANGYNILVNYLKLPYSSVHCCYDTFECSNPQLWALPKVMTYAAQTNPFIHIDGDVFIWEKFTSQLESAPLVAQNAEKGTAYYQSIMAGLKEKLSFIPDCLRDELEKASVSAYNAGILGGNDCAFLKEYAEKAIDFVRKNRLNDAEGLSSNINILFEQVLFYVMSSSHNKAVSCLFSEQIEDNGYSQSDFSDFIAVPYKLKYLHLIGSNKRHKATCEMMSRTLLLHYPEFFYRIVSLFKHEHAFFNNRIDPFFSFRYPVVNTFSETARSEDGGVQGPVAVLPAYSDSWQNISTQELYAQELAGISYRYFFYLKKEEQLQTVIMLNPHITITEANGGELDKKADGPVAVVADTITPCALVSLPGLLFEGISTISVDELDYNILAVLDTPGTLQEIIVCLSDCFSNDDLRCNQDVIYDLVLAKLKFLFHQKCIFICSQS